MTRDRIDQLAEHLFGAARSEQPSTALKHGLATLTPERSEDAQAPLTARRAWRMVNLGATAAAAVLMVSVVFVLRQRSELIDIAAEQPTRATVRPEPPPRAVEPETPPESADPRPSPGSAAEPRASGSGRGRAGRAPATLTDELAVLARARGALRSGDTKQALRELDHYDHVLKGTKLEAEASLLRIEALSRAGQAAEAASQARRFVKENPNSPLVDRARSFAEPSSDPSADR